jgi:hypothetical protein
MRVACSPASAEVGVLWSFVYLALRGSLELVLLSFRSAEANEVEILVLRVGARNSGVGPELQVGDGANPASMIGA